MISPSAVVLGVALFDKRLRALVQLWTIYPCRDFVAGLGVEQGAPGPAALQSASGETSQRTPASDVLGATLSCLPIVPGLASSYSRVYVELL